MHDVQLLNLAPIFMINFYLPFTFMYVLSAILNICFMADIL